MDEVWVDNGDVRLRVEVTGEGPVILCVHGWPELPHSWRHQVTHFAGRGHRVAAMEVRGYGASSAPAAIERYTLSELAGDVAAVARALSDDPVVLFGHDWGSPVCYQAAIRHPERVRAVAGLSVPHTPAMGVSLLDVFDGMYDDRFFYMLRFREPGVIEAEFDADVRAALRRVYYAGCGDAPPGSMLPAGPRDSPYLPLLPDPPPGSPRFLGEDDLDVLARTFEASGFTGAFNRYRALDHDPAADADILGAAVHQPTCFIGGSLDLVRTMVPRVDSFADPGAGCTDFRGSTVLEGVGHWVQQEAPVEVNAALEAFLGGL